MEIFILLPMFSYQEFNFKLEKSLKKKKNSLHPSLLGLEKSRLQFHKTLFLRMPELLSSFMTFHDNQEHQGIQNCHEDIENREEPIKRVCQ